MDQFETIMNGIKAASHGNTKLLDLFLIPLLKKIKSTCKTIDEFDAKCSEFIETACKQTGEDNRAFYEEYVAKIKEKV